jgi:hypothetical protein
VISAELEQIALLAGTRVASQRCLPEHNSRTTRKENRMRT